MHNWRAFVFLFVCLRAGVWLCGAQETSAWTIEAEHGVEFEISSNTVTATDGVVIRGPETVLTSQTATFNRTTGDVTAEGNVRLEHKGEVMTADSLQFNVLTRKIMGRNFKTGQTPFFVAGGAMVGDLKANVYAVANGMVTTDDVSVPGYRVRAKSIAVVPGEYIQARGATLYLGKVPVFYYPYYRRNLKRHPNYWTATPGYRSIYGPYLLTAYNWYWNEQLDGALHLDARAKRGLGVGPDVNWHLPEFGEGKFKGYYLHDLDPGNTQSGVSIPADRGRVWFSHEAMVRTNLTVKAVVRYQSDELIIHDFLESEYRKNPQPSTFFEVNQQWSNFTLDLMAQPRINRFYENVERLPDLKLTGLRQQIGHTPFYYESETSLGWFRREFAYDVTNSYSALRADTFQQVLLPMTLFNWLNLTPRVGGRFTHYGESDVYGTVLQDQNREVFNTGAELSFKASRVWPGVSSKFWQVDGLRHIIEPSLNYAYVPRPNRTPAQLPQFDSVIPTTRLLPIDFPDMNSIDSIDSENVIRLGLRNRLQTKRTHGIENLLHWSLYTDWRLKPAPGQSTFSDVYSELDLQPFSRLTLTSGLRFDVNRKVFNEATHAIILTPGSRWSIALGHNYLRDDFQSGLGTGNNLLYSTIYYRLNENWGARALQRYEMRDHVMEEQLYTIYRDFRSWTGALTFRVRDNRTGRYDYTVAVSFSLKAYPHFKLGEDSSKPSLLLGD